MVFQFKIQIKGITKPPVWRRIAVPADFTFLRFHQVIQEAFGWENCHLFEFRDKGRQGSICISAPGEDDYWGLDPFSESLDASKTKLSTIFKNKFRTFIYIYDFGDDWEHAITLESISNEKQKTAVCLAGKGACPPEDCGGIYGYQDIKDIFETKPKSKEANGYREWLGLNKGEVWDAEAFDIEKVTIYLKQITA
jgi:hypothetical protein